MRPPRREVEVQNAAREEARDREEVDEANQHSLAAGQSRERPEEDRQTVEVARREVVIPQSQVEVEEEDTEVFLP